MLAVSDIHNNLSCVKKLRAHEPNRFDAVVVAGDMGSDTARECLQVLSTFGCPVVYVYGNWDYRLDYAATFSPSAKLLHIEPIEVGRIVFAGFSGCPTHWGENPLAREIIETVAKRHRPILARRALAAERTALDALRINAKHDLLVAAFERKAQLRRPARYDKRIALLERRRDKENYASEQRVRAVTDDRRFKSYSHELIAAKKTIISENRAALVRRLSALGVNPARLVLVTHERLGHINAHYPGTYMHLYGHAHGFAHTIHQGTHCVNVSVLDRLRGVIPRRGLKKRRSLKDIHNVNAGTYTVIETDGAKTTITSLALPTDYPNWEPAVWAVIGQPLVPEEAQFGFYRPYLDTARNAGADGYVSPDSQ
jgi:hypothetical protein